MRFDEIQSVEAVTPKYDGDSRLMTELPLYRQNIRPRLHVPPDAIPAARGLVYAPCG